jgi:hypothetical protein
MFMKPSVAAVLRVDIKNVDAGNGTSGDADLWPGR